MKPRAAFGAAVRGNLATMARLFRNDFRHLFANVVSCIITVGLIIMPSIFAWYNILACWDVFDNTGNLTVAVANTDQGYESDLVPLRVNVGEQVVAALRANDQIDWTFTDEADAVDGARSGRYYAAVVIPPDFSRDMLTFYADDVQHAQVVYYANEKKNAIAPKITDQGADTVAYQINEVFVETLAEIGLSIAEAFSSYAESSGLEGRIGALAAHVDAVADEMESMGAVLGLYGQLVGSAQGLVDESAALVQSARGQADQAGALATEGAAGAASIVDALGKSGDALGDALDACSGSFDAVADAADQLFDTASSQASNAAGRLRTQADAIDGQASATQGVVSSLEALKGSLPADQQAAVQAAIDQLNATIGLMEAMSASLRQSADALDQGTADIAANRDEVKRLADEAKQSLAQAKADYEANVAPALANLSRYASDLAASLEASKGKLDGASSTLASAVGSAQGLLSGPASRIDAMEASLSEAASELHQVARDINEALASGSTEQLRQVLGADVQGLARAMAAPVGIERTAVFPADNFGSAMAPLYTTLALFIGALLILVVVKPTVSGRALRDLEEAGEGAAGPGDAAGAAATAAATPAPAAPAAPAPHVLFLGRFGAMAFLSLAQSTVMALGNMLFLQVQVANPVLLMLCFWFAGLVFTFIIYALVAAFANLGKAIAVLLLIVQVTGCGGSFPLQILPGFVQAVSPWLPATHVVNAMREAMFGTYQLDYWVQMGQLALFLVPAALIGLVLRKPLARFMAWYVEKVESSHVVG
ncbi:MAG: YhgE/Pip domain-containing protein [Eggerthellaceae bacterium]|nr:YhgE/Pip domain-containing protein [Eggerthellaceae bacterium]